MLENLKITSKYNGHENHSFSALYRTFKFLMVVSCRLATILVDSLAVTRPAGSVNASRYFAPVAYGTSPLPPRNTVGALQPKRCQRCQPKEQDRGQATTGVWDGGRAGTGGLGLGTVIETHRAMAGDGPAIEGLDGAAGVSPGGGNGGGLARFGVGVPDDQIDQALVFADGELDGGVNDVPEYNFRARGRRKGAVVRVRGVFGGRKRVRVEGVLQFPKELAIGPLRGRSTVVRGIECAFHDNIGGGHFPLGQQFIEDRVYFRVGRL